MKFKKTIVVILAVAMIISFIQLPIFATLSSKDNQLSAEDTNATDFTDNTIKTTDIPLSIDPKNIVEKGHVERLRTDEKNLNMAVFQNLDGTQTVYMFNNPIKYINDNGEIKDISTEIKSNRTIKNDKSYAYTVPENRFKQYFSESSNTGLMIESDDYCVEMIPISSYRISGNNSLISGNAVYYNNVFGYNTSVRYTPTSTGVKEDIILDSCPVSNSFSFIIYTDGLQMLQMNGKIVLTDSNNAIWADLGEVIVYDSNGLYGKGEMTYTTLKSNYAYTVTITVDTTYLNSEKTCYPVIVDPTLTIYEIDDIGEDDEYGDIVQGTAIEDMCIYTGTVNPININTNTTNYASIGNYYESPENNSRMIYRITEDYWDYNSLSYYLQDVRCQSVSLHVYGAPAETEVSVVTYPFGQDLGEWEEDISLQVSYSSYFQAIDSIMANNSNYNTTLISDSGEIEINITNAIKSLRNATSAERAKGIGLAVIGEGDTYDTELYNRLFVYQVERALPNNQVYITLTYFSQCYQDFSPGLYRISTNVNNASYYLSGSDKYLSHSYITTTNYLSVNNPNVARQLWSIKKVGTYDYIIVSALYRGSTYQNNVVLTYANNGNLTLREYNESDQHKWRIYKYNNEYRIANKSDSTKSIVLNSNSQGTSGICNLNIELADNLPATIANKYNETYSVGINSSGEINIKIIIDSSAIIGNITEQVIIDGVQSWEDTSNKIHIYVPGETAPTNCLEITVKGQNITNTPLGEFVPVYTEDYSLLSGTIYLYLNNISNKTIYDIQATVAHEMGHVLLLDHYSTSKNMYGEDIDLNQDIANDTFLSVMNSGLATLLFCKTIRPTALDRWMIYLKWGI